jgi:hypothetical protein
MRSEIILSYGSSVKAHAHCIVEQQRIIFARLYTARDRTARTAPRRRRRRANSGTCSPDTRIAGHWVCCRRASRMLCSTLRRRVHLSAQSTATCGIAGRFWRLRACSRSVCHAGRVAGCWAWLRQRAASWSFVSIRQLQVRLLASRPGAQRRSAPDLPELTATQQRRPGQPSAQADPPAVWRTRRSQIRHHRSWSAASGRVAAAPGFWTRPAAASLLPPPRRWSRAAARRHAQQQRCHWQPPPGASVPQRTIGDHRTSGDEPSTTIRQCCAPYEPRARPQQRQSA